MPSYEVFPSKIVADGQEVNNMSLWQTDRK